MDSQNDLAAAARNSVAARSWRRLFDDVVTRIGARFARAETRRTAGELLLGPLAPVERENGRWLAEHAGRVSPDRMQRLLRTAVWDHDRAGDLRDMAVERPGHPEAVLVTDETGHPSTSQYRPELDIRFGREFRGEAGGRGW